MQKITAEQAFKAMFFFLDHYWERCPLEYLGGILGELNITDNGTTMDTAAGIEWLECLEKAIQEPLTNEKMKAITINEAFDAMCLLLQQYSKEIKTEDFNIVLKDLQEYKEKGEDSKIGNEWLECVKQAIADKYPLDVIKFKRYS